jgi:phosphoribosylaminoimidazole-succinocarboxamide synthase
VDIFFVLVYNPIRSDTAMGTVKETNLPLPLLSRGKVRDIYDMGSSLLIVTTDRLSAFDVILNECIPNKGEVLNKLSEFWFKKCAHIVQNHFISSSPSGIPQVLAGLLNGRAMVVKKAKPLPVECIVRGYLTGSGLKEYNQTGTVCGVKLPSGLRESEKLPEPIFTPSTKAEGGHHDENITFDELVSLIGSESAETVRDLSMKIYQFAANYAYERGIIIADTKFEFGRVEGADDIIWIDEAITPDSSRFWSKKNYTVGVAQDSFDKQVVRDYLSGLNWDKTPPPPPLTQEIIDTTSSRYLEIFHILINEGVSWQ